MKSNGHAIIAVCGLLFSSGCKKPVPPTPVPVVLSLPAIYKIHKGDKVGLQVRPQDGVSFKWSTGEASALVWESPTIDTLYSVVGTSATSSALAQTTVIVE